MARSSGGHDRFLAGQRREAHPCPGEQDAEIVRAGPHVDEEHRGEEPRAQAGQCRGQAEGGA